MNNIEIDNLLKRIIRMNRIHKYETLIPENELEVIIHSRNLDTATTTIMALANAHPGLLIFGMGVKGNVIIEKYDQKKFIHDLKQKIATLTPKISYRLSPYKFRRYNLLLLFVEKQDIFQMPVHYFDRAPSTSFMRVNERNIRMTGPCVRALKNINSFGQFNESAIITRYRIKYADSKLVNSFYKGYMKLHKDIKLTKGELKKILNYDYLSNNLAYILSTSLYPQLYLPNLHIEIYNDMTGELRIFDGAIYHMFVNSISYIKKEYGYRIVISKKGIYRTKFCFHIGLLGELLYNALIHRDLSPFSIQIPIKITLRKNDIEIINPGYSFIDGDILKTNYKYLTNKNIKLINDVLISKVLPRHGFAYIRRIISMFSLSKPIITNNDGFFKVVIFKNSSRSIYKEPYTIESIILFCKEPKTKLELYQHFFMTDKVDYQYFYQKYVKKLVDNHFLVFTMPDTPKSKYQKLLATKEALSVLE